MSMSGDEASKKQRVSRACDSCRKKKVKCDGDSPICGNCQSMNLECTYKDTTKKRGPPRGYIEAIENRLGKLEGYFNRMVDSNLINSIDDPETKALIRELSAPLETSTGEQINGRPQRRRRKRPQSLVLSAEHSQRESSADSLLSPELFNSPSHPQYSESTPNSPAAESVDDNTGQLSMDETGHLRYLGRSSGFYYLQSSRTYQNGIFHFSGYKHKIDSRMKSKDMTDLFALPTKDLSDHLLEVYFTHFYPFLPLFYKRHLVLSFTPFETVSPLLLNAIYALASRMSSDIRVRSDPASPDTAGDVFFERAKRLLDGYYDTPKISTVQALILMASHQMGVMKAARAWLYSGMAFRMAQDLGLNRNCDHWNISPERRERRKRVFWCCFVVDRLTSASYGRSATFEERDCDVPFPSVDDDEKIYPLNAQSKREPASLLETFTNLIKICDILGNVLKNIYYAKAKQHSTSQHIDHILTTLHRQLIQWQKNLPPSLEYQPPNTQNGEETPDPPLSICQLHMLYHTTVILLHRSFIPGPTQTHLSSSLPSYKICELAACSILDIAVNMLRENHLRNAYNFAVYFIFTAGIIFIKLASSDDPRRTFDAKILINRAMRALDELEMTWLNAARGCNILGELAGLRDINLECDEYVPRRTQRRSPPPSIAVPNSPEIEDEERGPSRVLYQPFHQQEQAQYNSNTPYSQFNPGNDLASSSSTTPQNMPVEHQELHFSSNSSTSSSSNMPSSGFNTIKPTVDPFAAPEIIPVSSQQQFDPLGTAFWGVPSSFDMDEWNAYFDSLNGSTTQQQASTGQVSSLIMAPSELGTPSYIYDYQKRSSRDGSPLQLPGSPAQSLLFNLLEHPSNH